MQSVFQSSIKSKAACEMLADAILTPLPIQDSKSSLTLHEISEYGASQLEEHAPEEKVVLAGEQTAALSNVVETWPHDKIALTESEVLFFSLV